MSQYNLEPEIFPIGDVQIITRPFQQDPKFNPTVIAGTIHHGPDTTLILNPEFNIHFNFQEAEGLSYPFKHPAWNAERTDLILQGRTAEEATRLVLRKRHPIRVQVKTGVTYCRENRVILDSMNLIPVMQQQEIQVDRIFAVPAQTTVTRRADVARELAQNLQPMATNDAMHLLVHSSNQPLPRPSGMVPSAPPMSSQHSSFSTQAQTSSLQVDRPRVVRHVSHQQVFEAVGVIKDFFSADLFAHFQAPNDAPGEKLKEQPVNAYFLQASFKKYQNMIDGVTTTNTAKIFSELYGEGRVEVNLYKTKNKLTGNRVPFSLREGPNVVEQIVFHLFEGLAKLAEFHKNKEEAQAASILQTAQRVEALKNSQNAYNDKMARIGKQ